MRKAIVATLTLLVICVALPTAATAKTCSAGYTHATIGGAQKCLRRGEYCAVRDRTQYKRYSFVCEDVNGPDRLEPSSAAVAHGPRAHVAVVGGVTVDPGAWPWLAHIEDDVGSGVVDYCTGTVISPNVVLTAAHCADQIPSNTPDFAANFTVVTGSVDWTGLATRQVSAVKELIVHAWTSETSVTGGINIVGDAALLVLSTPTTAPPIPLADSSDLALVQPGVAADFAGWGLTDGLDLTSLPDALQAASTVVQNDPYCASTNLYFSSLAQLCTEDAPGNDTSTCEGDSGGPLIARDPTGTWVEIGITSTVPEGCDTGHPDYFTRAEYIEPWAQSWIAAFPPPPAALPPPAAVVPTPAPTPMPTIAPTQPTPPARPAAGSYAGKSSQQHGHLDLTEGTTGVVKLALEYNVHCAQGRRRGPYTQSVKWSASNPLTLVVRSGVWTFSTTYTTAGDGWRYAISGSFASTGAATGTLSVASRNGACATGQVHWTATT